MTGRYFYHNAHRDTALVAHGPAAQDALLDYCAELSGVALPTAAAA